LVPLLLQQQIAAIHEYLPATLEQNTGWVSFQLFDNKGRRIFPLAEPDLSTGDKFQEFVQQIDSKGTSLGRLELIADFSRELGNMRRENLRLAGALIVGLLVALSVIVVFSEIFVHAPLKQIALASNRIAEGDFGTPRFRCPGTTKSETSYPVLQPCATTSRLFREI
jgi:hypothetical protein